LFARTYESVGDFIEKQTKKISERLTGKKAVCAFSGGVDSAVAAMLVNKAAPDKLTCVFVDGLMRLNEREQIEKTYGEHFKNPLVCVDGTKTFLEKLSGITDPEEKRKIIGECYIRMFEEEAGRLGKFEFLVQGTIYPDIAESGDENSKLVKSHHNVGGLPKNILFEGLIEPLAELYKNEVREVGAALGLPDEVVFRQPFPGPGLAVRCLGEVTEAKLEILRRADKIVRDEITAAGLGRSIWQYFAILTNELSTGVRDGARRYGNIIAVRAVNSTYTVTAEWAKIPHATLGKISERIVGEIDEVNRVVYDITSKPPGTIEWE